MNEKYQAVIFDVDGTILDSENASNQFFEKIYVFMKGEKPEKAAYEKAFRCTMRETMDFLGYEENTEKGRQLLEMCQNADESGLPFEGIEEVIRCLKNDGKKLGIVTSRDEIGYRRGAENLAFMRLFDAIVTASHVKSPKPHPEPMHLCLSLLGVTPEQALFVGDSVYDIRAANAAGVDFALALWGAKPEGELADANFMLSHPNEILLL